METKWHDTKEIDDSRKPLFLECTGWTLSKLSFLTDCLVVVISWAQRRIGFRSSDEIGLSPDGAVVIR